VLGDPPEMKTTAAAARDKASIDGARAGRGFRYQDAVAASLAILGYVAADPWSVSPEANEDISLIVGGHRTYEIQAKSRRSQKRILTAADVLRFLAETWERHVDRLSSEDVRVCLVLDRTPVGCLPSGLETNLGEQADLPLHHLAEVAQTYGLTAHDLLDRSHLLVSESPTAFGAELLIGHLDLAPIAAEVLFRQVLARVGEIVDARAGGGAVLSLTPNEVARIVEEGQRIIDLAAIERPLRDGVCEYVDLETPIQESAFYLGVDVVAGHVAAGLVADRPEDVEQCIGTLERTGQAVVAGPSGIGKSAVAYLVANATKHTVRWLRVREPGSAFEILKLTEALRATKDSPVGLLMDDIGRIDASMWDELARRARERNGVYLLGTTREEDLDLLEEAAESTVVRPRLDEALAEALWQHLKGDAATTAPSWVEAFEESNGLTLEFVHYLTTGTRLPETLVRQVQDRRREKRDDELKTLRVVCLAASSGARIDVRRFALACELRDEDVQRALQRLVEEHLVQSVGEGELGGLHRLRSGVLLEATHETLPPSLAETAVLAIQCTSTRDLPVLLADLWVRELVSASTAYQALRARLETTANSGQMAACLDGLRAASIQRYAERATAVLDRYEVPLALRRTTANLALVPDRDLDGVLDPRIARAVPTLRELELEELRADWLKQLPDELRAACAQASSATDGIALIGALGMLPLESDFAIEVARSTPPISDPPSVAEFLNAGRLAGPAVAEACLDVVGGAERVLELARCQPWVSHLEVKEEQSTDSSGKERVIEFRLMCLDGGLAEGPHDAVVDLTRLYFGLFPDVDVVAGRAVDASDASLGYRGHEVANKRIPRLNMPSLAEVRWNRAILNSFAEAGAESRTERLMAEASLLHRVTEVTRQLSYRWARREQMSAAQRRVLKDIAEQAGAVWRRDVLPANPTAPQDAQVDIGDLASSLKMLCGNALPRLFAKPDMAVASLLVDTVYRELERTVGIGYWRLLGSDLDEEVSALASLVLDLHQVVGLRLREESESTAARLARRSATPFEELALVAREHHQTSFEAEIASCAATIERLGFKADIYRLDPQKPVSLVWPPDDLVIVVHVESLYEWLTSAPAILEAAQQGYESVRTVAIVPSRMGSIVPAMAIRTLASPDRVPFPGVNEAERLVEAHSLPYLAGTITPSFLRVVSLEGTQSGLERLSAHRDLLPEEAALSASVDAEIDEVLAGVIDDVRADTSGLLSDVISEFFGASERDDLASTLSAISRGEADEALGILGILLVVELELSIDPQRAGDGLARLIEEHVESPPSDVPIEESNRAPASSTAPTPIPKVGRNQRCPCGSGTKYKHCHGS
jgi:hypothetical protein